MNKYKKQTSPTSLRDKNLVEKLKVITEAILPASVREKDCFGGCLMLRRYFMPCNDAGEKFYLGGS